MLTFFFLLCSAAFNAALELQPADPDAQMWCGLALSRLKRYEEGESSFFERACVLTPARPALAHFDAALLERPDDAHGHFLRDEALQDFDYALRLEPTEPFMRNSRGCLRRGMFYPAQLRAFVYGLSVTRYGPKSGSAR